MLAIVVDQCAQFIESQLFYTRIGSWLMNDAML